MTKKYYTDGDVRNALVGCIFATSQASVSRASRVKPQNVSLMAQGAPIRGKLLAWLGYRQVKGIYERNEP